MAPTIFCVFCSLHEVATRRRRLPSARRGYRMAPTTFSALRSLHEVATRRREESRRQHEQQRMTSTTSCVFRSLHEVTTRSTVSKTGIENSVDNLLCLSSSSRGRRHEEKSPVGKTKNREWRRRLSVSFVLSTDSPRGVSSARR